MIDKSASLRPDIGHIVEEKGTEYPGSGRYNRTDDIGTYLCRRCGLALFRSSDKFLSSCGWPSFDDEIMGSIKRVPDIDGRRTEILCQRCEAHLGHVFQFEGLTAKNLRHCVNSLALDFVNSSTVSDSDEAILAGGCFWGVEYHLKQLPGVLTVESGYTGGQTEQPSYQEVCGGNSGHYEAVRVLYDPAVCEYENLLKLFFEIHDPCQQDGQGPDIGEQYRSAVFYFDQQQKRVVQGVMDLLCAKGFTLATQLLPVSVFWPAEDYHQDYYHKNNKVPYCHRRVKRFE